MSNFKFDENNYKRRCCFTSIMLQGQLTLLFFIKWVEDDYLQSLLKELISVSV